MPSRLSFRRGSITMCDSDVVLLVQIVIDCIDEADDRDRPWLSTIRDVWWHAIHESGFGLMDLRLDELVASDSQARDLVDLLKRAIEHARSFAPAFPLEWANRMGLAGIVYEAPVPTQYIMESLIRTIGLLASEAKWWD